MLRGGPSQSAPPRVAHRLAYRAGLGACHSPHSSDRAVALAAPDARGRVWFGPGRRGRLTNGELYRDAVERRSAEMSLHMELARTFVRESLSV